MLVHGRATAKLKCQLSSDMLRKRDGEFPIDPVEPKDPGAALWWIDQAGDLCVIACDAWDTVQGNFRAIALNIRAIRALHRTKATQISGRVQQSFRVPMLAASNPIPPKPPCAEVLGLAHWPVEKDELDRTFRRLAKAKHPDPGGEEVAFKRLSSAYAECVGLLQRTA